MLGICFTFDYELFFGKNNGSDDEILFDPTQKLINVLVNEGVSATFFADTCSVYQHEKYNKFDYNDKFRTQICNMKKNNQDVQLHIHSHWLNSKLVDGEWIFDENSYRLQCFDPENSEMDSINQKDIIEWGVEYLNETLGKIDKKYKCIAYRAGGFCIQPHQKIIQDLHKCGIRIDSSVAPQLYSLNTTNGYDFRHSVKHTNWHLSSETPEWWSEGDNKASALYEIPVGTIDKNIASFLIRRIFSPNSIKLDLGEKRGTYISTGIKQHGKWDKLQQIYRYVTGFNAISLDNYQAEYLYEMISRYYKKNHCNKRDGYIAVIGHPKLVSENYLINLSKFIDLLRASELDIQITSIPMIYKNLEENKS